MLETAEEKTTVSNPRMELANKLKPMGLRPYFYKDEDVEQFLKILDVSGISDSVDLASEFYTLIKPFDLLPIKDSLFTYEQYGVMSLNLTDFLMRANLGNVHSCHSLGNGNEHCPGGNLNYIANPAWSCIAIYKDKASTCDFDRGGLSIGFYKPSCPNLLATANICLGSSEDGEVPTIYISRIYGSKREFINALPKIVAHFSEYRVAMLEHGSRIGSLLTRAGGNFISVPIDKPLVKHGSSLVERYDDINQPIRFPVYDAKSEEKVYHTAEYQDSTCQSGINIFSDYMVSNYRTIEEMQTFSAYMRSMYSGISMGTIHSMINLNTIVDGWYGDEVYFYCAECDRRSYNDDSYYVDGVGSLCESCYSNNYTFSEVQDCTICVEDAVTVAYPARWSVGRVFTSEAEVGHVINDGYVNADYVIDDTTHNNIQYYHGDLVREVTVLDEDGSEESLYVIDHPGARQYSNLTHVPIITQTVFDKINTHPEKYRAELLEIVTDEVFSFESIDDVLDDVDGIIACATTQTAHDAFIDKLNNRFVEYIQKAQAEEFNNSVFACPLKSHACFGA